MIETKYGNSKLIRLLLWCAIPLVCLLMYWKVPLVHGVVNNVSKHDFVIVIATLSLSSLRDLIRENYNRPRYRITCSEEPPYQLIVPLPSEESYLQFIRLSVQNVGRTGDEACEVRIERIEQLSAEAGTDALSLVDHDPRPLKWAGRDTNPIAIGAGAFDFVDLGMRRIDFLHTLRMDFGHRGFYDLKIEDESIRGFRLTGHIYGKHARPKLFQLELEWDILGDLNSVRVKEV